jgi:asparagine synthase (glutamine-hydrolysing)
MCGIAGLIDKYPVSEKLQLMTVALSHRGPDAEGYWSCGELGIGLGHRRLSILDLSSMGNQPMVSGCGRYVITFNGEIYNFSYIKKTLERENPSLLQNWKGTSDTEIILEAISCWGILKAIKSFEGMFAFGLWDRKEKVLYLARDRIGEKPIYYGDIDGVFYFGSELKAITAVNQKKLHVNRNAIASLIEFGYIKAPISIYQGISKLSPGNLLKVAVSALGEFEILAEEKYWSLCQHDHKLVRHKNEQISDDQLIEDVHNLLIKTVQQVVVSDVPIGAFLSGGIDSSLIVAIMQTNSSKKVNTFTVGFKESDFDEAPFAREVAKHLKTLHNEIYLSARDALNIVPSLGHIYDEPLGDSSQIPTLLVSQLAKSRVKVALTGDGGDELFLGYKRYQIAVGLWNNYNTTPEAVRHASANIINFISSEKWEILFKNLPSKYKSILNKNRIFRLAKILKSNNLNDFYKNLISHYINSSNLVLGTVSSTELILLENYEILDQMREYDIANYLPDDILAKVDRASMSESLETRSPFLSHKMVELAWSLPKHLLINKNNGKWILRKILEEYVPKSMFLRPKQGFSVPIGDWLRLELREWAEDLLDECALREQGYLDPKLVRKIWNDHLSSRSDNAVTLWNILSFQAWLKNVGHVLG